MVVGCGALGTVQAEVLARAGVGRLTLIDRDFVELSNLHRQFLFDEADAVAGTPKAVAAAARIKEVNSQISVDAQVADLEPRTVRELLGGADLILDATDNFETRYLINDYAVETGTPWIYGAAAWQPGPSLSCYKRQGLQSPRPLPTGCLKTVGMASLHIQAPGTGLRGCS